MKKFKFLNVLLSAVLCAYTALPCTTFVLEGKGAIYFGRNLDWFWEDGLVIVNPKNIHKTAFTVTDRAPATWVAKYGSVTFNQFGRELPFGGMNEAGLVVENMWLDETKYAPRDSRPAISLLQWIQYQLDNCRTVAEVIASDSRLRIEPPPPSAQGLARVHYLVCDAAGDVATIEFLNGKMAVHHGANLPCRALANSTYADSLGYFRAHPEEATATGRSKNDSSSCRFSHAAGRVKAFKASQPEKNVRYAFDTLDQVAAGNFTVWRIVYDVPGRKIHYRTRSNRDIRTLDLKALDFSPEHGVRFADIQAKPVNGQVQFQELTDARHRKYLESFYGQESLKEKMGDLTLLTEALIFTLKSYTPVQGKVAAASK